jgi:foldase protein PrsA
MRAFAAAVAALVVLAAPASAQAPPIATVDGVGEIAPAEYRHWKKIARRGSPRSSERALRRQVMQLLVQNLWVTGETAERGIVVTRAEVDRAFRRQRRQSFRTRREFPRFLRRFGYTVADIKYRVRLERLSSRLRRRVMREIPPVTEEEVRAHYDQNLSDFVVEERRDVRYAVARTRAAASAKRKRLRLRAARGQFPAAVFRQRRGVVRWRGRWLAFVVVRVRPRHTQPFARARPNIRAVMVLERQQAALDAFIDEFRAKWRERTSCREVYAIADCGRTTP